MKLVERKNPSRARLAAMVVLGIVVTAAIMLLFDGNAKAAPPGEYVGPSNGNVQERKPDPKCQARGVPSPTLGYDCTPLGKKIGDDVMETTGAALASCAAGAYFGGWVGCQAAADGSLATSWTGWGD